MLQYLILNLPSFKIYCNLYIICLHNQIIYIINIYSQEMYRRGQIPNKFSKEEMWGCSNCKRLVKKIEAMNEAFQRQLDKLTMESKIHKEERSRMEEKLEDIIQLNRNQEREIKHLEIKLQEKEEEIRELPKNKKMAPQPKMEPREEARQQGPQQKLMQAAKVKVWSDLEKKQQLRFGSGLLELPTKLCLLKEFRWLNVKQPTDKVPQSLGNLSKLQTLVINDNTNLKQLPKSFKNLKELNVLGIDWEMLPKQNIFKTDPLVTLKNLQKLYIGNKQFKQMRKAIKKEGSR